MTAGYDLREWRDDDAGWYIGARDRTILRWTTEPDELTADEFVAGVAKLDGVSRSGFAVVNGDGRLVGNVAAVRDDGTAEISYWIEASARGRGAAQYALTAMTSWVVDNWQVARIELQITPDNAASAAVASRCGYVLVGRRELCLSCAGDDGTVVIYAQEVAPTVS